MIDREEIAEPVWEIATLYPNQGVWHENEYLDLDTNRLIEFDNGYVEVLPVPTDKHQAIILFLSLLFVNFARRQGGTVRTAGIRIRLWDRKYREPDLVYLKPEHEAWRHQRYWDGADLVVEIVSASVDDRERDLVQKRSEYAQAGIPEYWIVDYAEERITVLWLDAGRYVEHGSFGRGETANSILLSEFAVEVSAVLDAD